MANFIMLTLDTTPPQVEVLTPSYTTTSARTEIRIKSNEILANWQDIYIIDSLGERHDVTFRYDDDEFVGTIIFEGYPYGITTIYARVMDDVGNLSPIVSKSINIVGSETLTISIRESINSVVVKDRIRNVVKVKSEEAK